jgi:hypothetical protein
MAVVRKMGKGHATEAGGEGKGQWLCAVLPINGSVWLKNLGLELENTVVFVFVTAITVFF